MIEYWKMSNLSLIDYANSPSIVITSISSAEQYWDCLGLYRWDDEKNCYKQVDKYFNYQLMDGHLTWKAT